VRAGLALIVVALNVTAIVSILGTRGTAGRKLVWTAAVVLVPVFGALGWLTTRRRSRGHARARRRGVPRARSGARHGRGR
jgi:hypothetical protein